MKRLLVLRPEPGNQATVHRAREIGMDPVTCPLFTVEAAEWIVPDVRGFDYILFTSANALRHGGDQLGRLTELDALAVGPTTADAASAVGFRVVMTGGEGIEKLLEALPARRRLLHLAGADHHHISISQTIETVVVYRSVELAAADIPSGELVALVHSPRAAARFAALVPDRARVSIVAISHPAAVACGAGWASIEVADQPSDAALLALAARLCQD